MNSSIVGPPWPIGLDPLLISGDAPEWQHSGTPSYYFLLASTVVVVVHIVVLVDTCMATELHNLVSIVILVAHIVVFAGDDIIYSSCSCTYSYSHLDKIIEKLH